MNRSLLWMLLAAPATLLAQGSKTFVIDGRLKNMEAPAGKVYMIYQKGGAAIVDSAGVKHGAYQLRGEMEENQAVALMDVRPSPSTPPFKDVAYIYLSADTFRITHIDSFSNITVKGPEANADYQLLVADLKPYNEKEIPIIGRFQALQASGDTAAIQSFRKQYIDQCINLEIEKQLTYKRFAKQHPSSPVALYALRTFAGDNIDPESIRPLFDGLSSAVRNSKEGKTFEQRLETAENTAIGKQAIDFTQNDTLGRPVSLSAFRGKWVLLDFWASWCGPCRAENPNVAKAYEKFHAKGFEVLGVSLDRPEDKTNWLKAIHDDRLAWTQVSDLGFWNNAVAKSYGVATIPQNFLIDPQGTIVAKDLKGEALEQKLEEIFNN